MQAVTVPSDIEIAQRAKPRRITDVAADIGLGADDLDLYGKYKAKIPLEVAERPARGRLVLVTAINPTPAGEGKSTVTVGLAQALRRQNVNAILCMREPSLGPVFGVKGGAAGVRATRALGAPLWIVNRRSGFGSRESRAGNREPGIGSRPMRR